MARKVVPDFASIAAVLDRPPLTDSERAQLLAQIERDPATPQGTLF